MTFTLRCTVAVAFEETNKRLGATDTRGITPVTALAIFLPAAALFVGALYVADRLCTEWQTRCPDCRRRID